MQIVAGSTNSIPAHIYRPADNKLPRPRSRVLVLSPPNAEFYLSTILLMTSALCFLAGPGVTRGLAQEQPQAAAPQQQQQLLIQVKQGDGAIHKTGEKTGSEIVVAVLNELELPVPNATVVFQGPPDGAGVLFTDDAKMSTVTADSEGIARVASVRSNRVAGPVVISVTASFEGKTGTAAINQVTEKSPVVTKKRAAIVGGVAAAIVVPVLALRTPPPPTASISAPVGTVGK